MQLQLTTKEASTILQNDGVIAYPTETVWGFGCLANKPSALRKLLAIKNRSADKGLILLGNSLDMFNDFVDFSKLSASQIETLLKPPLTPTSWLVPAKENVSLLVRGRHSSIAIRFATNPSCKELIAELNTPIVSTSANQDGLPICKIKEEIRFLFDKQLDGILEGDVGCRNTPSQIIDLLTKKVIRP